MNYFDLLGIERSYQLDKNQLKEKYLEKQIAYHPDNASDPEQKNQHITLAMQINEAYKTLQDDYLRAQYMLSISGIDMSDKELSKNIKPVDLEKLMSLYEKIDDSDTLVELKHLQNEELSKKNLLIQDLTCAFQSQDFMNALDLTINMNYLNTLIKYIDQKIKDIIN